MVAKTHKAALLAHLASTNQMSLPSDNGSSMVSRCNTQTASSTASISKKNICSTGLTPKEKEILLKLQNKAAESSVINPEEEHSKG